jgi:hypothetical protein
MDFKQLKQFFHFGIHVIISHSSWSIISHHPKKNRTLIQLSPASFIGFDLHPRIDHPKNLQKIKKTVPWTV